MSRLISNYFATLFDFKYKVVTTADNGDGTGTAYVDIRTHNFDSYMESIGNVLAESPEAFLEPVILYIATDGKIDEVTDTAIDVMNEALNGLEKDKYYSIELPLQKADDGKWYLVQPAYKVLNAISDGWFEVLVELVNEVTAMLQEIGAFIDDAFSGFASWVNTFYI